MSKQHTTTHHASHNGGKIAEAARDLIVATEEVAEEKIAQARGRLQERLDQAKELAELVQERAVDHAKDVDKHIRKNPYQALGIATGVGVLIGFVLARR